MAARAAVFSRQARERGRGRHAEMRGNGREDDFARREP